MPTRVKQTAGGSLAASAAVFGSALGAAALLWAAGCERPAATAAGPARVEELAAGEAPAAGAAGGPGAAAKRPAETPGNARVLARTFDDIKFDIEPDAPFDRQMLTDEIERLNGKRIEIRGYIYPSAQKKLQDFVLVRDNQECCFGPGAALYDCILVSMEPGKVADFSVRPVAVTGRFRIEPFEFDGVTRAVFRMTADEVSR